MQHSLLLQGGTVVNADMQSREDVLMENGTVKDIGRYMEEYETLEDVGGKLLMPALIDCHVHFREPGLEHKATMKTEAASAAAGGVLTVCEMPNTNPPTVTVAALADKVRRAAEIFDVDIRFFFGITQDIHLAAFLEMMDSSAEEMQRLRARLAGVKIFLDHSTGNQKIADELIASVFKACADHHVTLVAHCENPEMNAAAAAQNTDPNVASHSAMRPADSERVAIEYAIGVARVHGTNLHIAHLSTAGGVELVKKAKAEGLNITCEVAPHHLFLTTNDYTTLGTLTKMNPPVRSEEHRSALWQGIADGVVDCISTDHAPHTLEEKTTGEPLKAPSGVPGVETMLPLLLSVAAGHWPHPNDAHVCPTLSYSDIVRLCMTNPSRIFKLGKNDIEKEKQVAVLVIDPEATWTIEGKKLHSKCGWTPFEGWTVKGKLERIVR